ncbi:MAG TPA: amino acid permease [Thermoanaerobaculaceae bacterium]|nr:amino acid permease [Thermoanaerobaculaceae bacterium]
MLRKAITLRHAVALYVSSVLGSGVLVLPGLAARLAGPASLIAWGVLSLASYPFAYTFASLSARNPESGGVYAFAKEAFGRHAAAATGWLFGLWFIAGAPAATLIAASYVGYAFPVGRLGIHLIAGGVIVVPFLVNLRGIVFSNRVQLAIVAAIVALLVAAAALSMGSVRAANFSPFLPNGLLPVGTAAALIFWSYLGYENVSNVAEEFEDPKRDFNRSVLASVVLIGVLYLSVAFVTVGTGAYEAGGSVAPFAAIFANVLGRWGAVGTAILAVVITLGTANAYIAGMSRVALAVARDGALPRAFARVSAATGAPWGSLTLLTGLSLAMLAVYYALEVNLQTALLIPSGAAVLVYVIGSAAGIRLLGGSGVRRALPWISLLISVIVLPFVGWLALVALASAAAALAYSRWARPASTG